MWWAQFQNDPKPIGSDLFREPTFYSTLPPWSFRPGYGADLAYTTGATSDWFASVAAKVYGRKVFILDVQRHKLDAPLIESTLKRMLSQYGQGTIYSYMSGPEVGLAKLLRERGVPMQPLHARYNKLVRAQRTIRRWNEGDIVVPEGAAWLKGFLHRVSCFRGNDHDEGDDEVDALVSLCDGMVGSTGDGVIKTVGPAYSGL